MWLGVVERVVRATEPGQSRGIYSCPFTVRRISGKGSEEKNCTSGIACKGCSTDGSIFSGRV